MSVLPTNRLVVVSNRLPVVLDRQDGALTVQPGSGGLISALAPILSARGGAWVGWPATFEADGVAQALAEYSASAGYAITPVMLTEAEVQGYYYGFANEILWPLLHGFETRCNFDPHYWQAYQSANQKFADIVHQTLQPGDYVWIHDYQLMLVGEVLRQAGFKERLGFFLHIPFPAPEVFFKLPWRAQLLRGLLAFDLIGFQTLRHRRNFIHCLQQLDLPDLHISGRGDVVTVRLGGRSIRVGAFPISIDYAQINQHAANPEVTQRAEELRQRFGVEKLIMGMDRLDYTKGIPQRLEAFRLLLHRRPDLRDKVYLFQVTVPSRENVPEYERLRSEIERRVSEINGEFTSPGRRVPIQYLHQSFGRDDVYAFLRAADLALVTPLRDGMNLVAKEYCACQIKADGVLILSEFAGAAAELGRGALLINPYDVEATSAAIEQALAMPQVERRRRMRRLRAQIAENDIFHWLDEVLHAAFDRRLSDFPRLHDHVPTVDLALDAQG
jgi:alpha,alpha-trehalose-phosphate synthase [UDP-forming]